MDATTRGTPLTEQEETAGSAAAGGSGGGGAETGGTSGAPSGGGGLSGGGVGGGAAGGLASAGSGGTDAAGGSGGADVNAGGDASAGADPGVEAPLGDLPHELPDSPVQGVLTLTETTGPRDKTFQIVTPLASYGVTASTGSIVTMDDRSGGNIVQWVSASSKVKRRAGIAADPQPVMTTTLDQDSFTARHVRLLSTSQTGDWAWTWDFYATQTTLTITTAAGPYSFTFSGTPGDQLTSADSVVPQSGVAQSAVSSLLLDLAGPAEWAYITDASYNHSLYLIQHQDDDLPERYDALGGDTATWVFGDGQIAGAQRRFSLGFIGSAAVGAVRKRVEFVIGAVR